MNPDSEFGRKPWYGQGSFLV